MIQRTFLTRSLRRWPLCINDSLIGCTLSINDSFIGCTQWRKSRFVVVFLTRMFVLSKLFVVCTTIRKRLKESVIIQPENLILSTVLVMIYHIQSSFYLSYQTLFSTFHDYKHDRMKSCLRMRVCLSFHFYLSNFKDLIFSFQLFLQQQPWD